MCLSVCTIHIFSDMVSLHEVQWLGCDTVQIIMRRDLAIDASLACCDSLPGYCSNIPHTLSTAEPSKCPKSRLNATLNTNIYNKM